MSAIDAYVELLSDVSQHLQHYEPKPSSTFSVRGWRVYTLSIIHTRELKFRVDSLIDSIKELLKEGDQKQLFSEIKQFSDFIKTRVAKPFEPIEEQSFPVDAVSALKDFYITFDSALDKLCQEILTFESVNQSKEK